jgi:hypothetical protein
MGNSHASPPRIITFPLTNLPALIRACGMLAVIVQKWGNYGGEKLDWRRWIPQWSTSEPTTAADWVSATATPIDKQVTPESLEPMAVVEVLQASGIAPCKIKPSMGSCFVISFPRLFNGFFSASSLPGLRDEDCTTTFTYSANCNSPCSNPKPYIPCAPPTSGDGVCTSAATEWNAMDTLITSSAAVAGMPSNFSNRFNWHTFQYVIVQTNCTLRLDHDDLDKFTGMRITNHQTKLGTFSSSSPMLNKIYSAFQQTYEGLTVSGMQVDCTNRERLGYGGDAHSRIEFAMDSYSSHALYSKWLVDWHDTQLMGAIDDTEKPHIFGNVPNTAPTYSGAGSPM